MQFLFGSDRDNGYGILYTDGRQNEVDQIKDRINVPGNVDGVDIIGFAPFDSNNNRPLFYRIKTDTDYPRGAYFIHGIYQDKNPGYYKGTTCLADLFARFMDQTTVNSIRAGEKISEGTVVEPELNALRSQFRIDPSILLDILVRIYQGEKIIISVRDDVFSIAYARVLVSHIFDYLTPSLKKTCSFAAGAISSAELGDAKIRIVPAGCAVSDGSAVIDATAAGYSSTIDSEFVSIVGKIIGQTPETREVIFSNYEVLFNGNNSMYLPKKFTDYIKAISGDAVVSEKIIDNYLGELDDPSKENVPSFISNSLSAKFNSPEAVSLFNFKSPDEAFATANVLAANSLILKKLFIFSQNAEAIITSAFHRVFSSVEINASNVNTISEKINDFRKGIKEVCTKYEACFYKAAGAAYSELQGRVDLSKELYKRAYGNISSAISKQGANIANPKQLIDALMSQCADIFSAARNAGINIESKIMDDAKKLIEENNKKFPGTPNGGTREALTGLNNLSAALTGKADAPGIMDRMSSVMDTYAEFDKVVDFYAAKYAVKVGESLKNGAELAFTKLNDSVRIKKIAAETALIDPVAATYLYVAYGIDDDRFIAADLVQFIVDNYKAFDRIADSDLDDCVNKITGLVMGKIMGISGDTSADADVDGIFSRYINGGECYNEANMPIEGKSLTLIDAIIKAWISGGHSTNAIIKIKTSKGGSSSPAGVIISGIVGLVAGALVAAVVLNPGMFGFGKSDNNAAVTDGTATTAITTVAETDEETATSEVTTIVTTEDAVVSTEITTEVPETTEVTTETTEGTDLTTVETDSEGSDTTDGITEV